MDKKEISGDAFFEVSQGSRATQLPAYQLTPIEQALLHALSTGASNKQIAKTMLKSEQTVRNQLSTLFKKIHANNRTQAACWYRERVDIRWGVSPAPLLSAGNAPLIEADMRHQHGPKVSL
jgi:DNA-binding NarL/FixJ family response regulator